MRALRGHRAAVALAAITAVAAALRLIALQHVPDDAIYDAVVLSMGRSLHNFFYGAFEPGGTVSIDKPPIDLWFQVFSVKLFGFNSFALKLPEALCGTLAVPLLFDALRRPFGAAAGLAGAAVLAVLPIAVLTARSDTMDSVMMLTLVASAWCVVRAASGGRFIWVIAAGAAAGLAFNVKLFEMFIALPGLAVMIVLSSSGDWRARLLRTAAAGAVFVVVAFAWLTVATIAPSHDKPFPLGSTHGSVFEAAVVFNGLTRIRGSSSELPKLPPRLAHKQLPPPSPGRLFSKWGPLSGRHLGFALFAAIVFGGLGTVLALLGLRGQRRRLRDADRLVVGAMAGLAVWLLTGLVLYSKMVRLYPRYVEAFTPAVAAAFGVGFVMLSRRAIAGSREAALALTGGTLACCAYLTYLFPAAAWPLAASLAVVVAGAVIAFVAALRSSGHARVAAMTTGLVLAFAGLLLPLLVTAERIVSSHASDSLQQQQRMSADAVARLSRFFRANTQGSRYEFAVGASLRASQLIVMDRRPVMSLTAVSGAVVTPSAELAAAVRRGDVRYALIGERCRPGAFKSVIYCSEPARWVAANGTDISRRLGFDKSGVVYDLAPRIAPAQPKPSAGARSQ